MKLRIPDRHHIIHYLHHGMHCVYLGAVTVFAHGPYAYAAGGLLAIVILGAFMGENLE